MECVGSQGIDYLSNLPSSIIDIIMALLPLGDAVRTSVLSTEWRHRWKYVPSLIFDYHFCKPPLCFYKLESIIHRVLLQHRGHIQKLALELFAQNHHKIDSWLHLLPSSKLQDFTFQANIGIFQVLPPHFFSFQSLVHLKLYKCEFHPPPQCGEFPKLITLDLHYVELMVPRLEKFISLCSVLEKLRIVFCSSMGFHIEEPLEVDAPCLRSFVFLGPFKTIHFKNSPALTEVSLSILVSLYWQAEKFEYFHFVPSLVKLHLHPHVLDCLAEGEMSELTSLKYLNLSMYLDSVEEVASALRLARNSPNLETLHVSLYASTYGKGGVVEFLEEQEKPDDKLSQIRKVRISVFSGLGAQTEFVKYLLSCGRGLEEVAIVPAFTAPMTDSALMELLNEFPRASPNAKLLLLRR